MQARITAAPQGVSQGLAPAAQQALAQPPARPQARRLSRRRPPPCLSGQEAHPLTAPQGLYFPAEPFPYLECFPPPVTAAAVSPCPRVDCMLFVLYPLCSLLQVIYSLGEEVHQSAIVVRSPVPCSTPVSL